MFGFSLLSLWMLCSAEAMAQEVIILGWSADERYFAVRTIEKIATDEEIEANQEGELQDLGPDAGPVGFCPEYVDPMSKRPFRGDMKISMYKISSSENGPPKVELISKPYVIYKEGTRGSEHHSCTPQKEAEKNLQSAKKAMSKRGIVISPRAHNSLQFIERQSEEPPLSEKSTSYLITDWDDAIAKEVSNQGHYDEEPVRVDISLDRFVDQYETGVHLVGHIYVLREKGEDAYFVVTDGVREEKVRQNPPQLLNEAAVTQTYDAAFAGDGGIDLIGVYASPSNRIVVFATSVWDFNYDTLRSENYQFPFAIERWPID